MRDIRTGTFKCVRFKGKSVLTLKLVDPCILIIASNYTCMKTFNFKTLVKRFDGQKTQIALNRAITAIRRSVTELTKRQGLRDTVIIFTPIRIILYYTLLSSRRDYNYKFIIHCSF